MNSSLDITVPCSVNTSKKQLAEISNSRQASIEQLPKNGAQAMFQTPQVTATTKLTTAGRNLQQLSILELNKMEAENPYLKIKKQSKSPLKQKVLVAPISSLPVVE